ncbi:MAG: anhydro-N-acetylmuramic acid kinase [Phycisphaerae bacterium]|nr:anhydro-N-acetylmuramic acid kinase [Phycisphaerae bacterium]NUQ44891.1 anhydro-N-acetylmuramic acid kinase [Phycisphaerae bacterium]
MIVVGLMSGTSADGVDAVACRVRGRGLHMRPTILSHVHRAYSKSLREAVLHAAADAAMPPADLCRLHWRLGRAYANAAAAAIKATGLPASDIAGVGCHGQTICHLPAEGATWQLGEPAVIAGCIGVPVVARFREADVAAGGQGAPLVPWTDYVLFRHARRARAVQNIGGIANVTYIPAAGNSESVRAFDTGPGNMVIDALARRFSHGKRPFDRNGRWAARGRVVSPLLEQWLRHPFFARRPPKSCGREEFGELFAGFVASFLRKGASPEDVLATATRLTACTIADAYRRFFPARRGRLAVDEIILCGGGAKNRTLRRMLEEELSGVSITTVEDYAIPLQAKEALSFAMLAAACMQGVPANLPRVTGARRPVVLGSITPSGRPTASPRVR